MKKVLITGVSGLLGSNLAYCLKDQFEILGLYHSRIIHIPGISSQWADLRSLNNTETILREFNPHAVIHCAAQADVDTCELEPERAREANVLSTINLVRSIGSMDTKMIHISTDLVYGGSKESFNEMDPVYPVNYYGITKLDSEREALKSHNALVLRTNFFGWGITPRQSLAQWLISELRAGRPVKGFKDVVFSSMYTFDMADIIVKMIDKDLSGIYNCGSSNSISKYQFLALLADKAGFDPQLISPVSVDQVPFKAKRVKNLSLDVSKLANDLDCDLPTVQIAVDHFVADFKNENSLGWELIRQVAV